MNDAMNPPVGVKPSYFEFPRELRVLDSKIVQYLLNKDHPKGGPKAVFFESVGHNKVETELFRSTMRTHAASNPIASTVHHQFGTKRIIDCFVEMPNGREYCIRTVWNDHNDGQPPLLITAHPLSAG